MIHRIKCAWMRANIHQLRMVAALIVPLTAAEALAQASMYGRAAQISARLANLEAKT